ncbi:MAG: TIGR02757 family protein [Gemmatimonadetes bacterium]|nr:TIGR02757 family protein [Gemmatimonadota bacterium]MYB62145.1 TIGR02757 family protein [Gemmatimonadota bacterium]
MTRIDWTAIGNRLDVLYRSFDPSMISPDPLEVVRRFEGPEDQEIAGLVAASLAYGRAETITAAAGEALRRMGDAPWDFVMNFDPVRDGSRFNGFVYRWTRGRDLSTLAAVMGKALRRYGSLGALFAAGHRPSDTHTGPALAHFTDTLLGFTREVNPGEQHERHGTKTGIRYLLPSPVSGSACKRMNLYIRWMVRREAPDLGLWPRILPARLVTPIDTHVARISRRLGLTSRKQADWKMAEEVTRALRRFDPEDPVKYDFALCHWGMLEYRKR